MAGGQTRGPVRAGQGWGQAPAVAWKAVPRASVTALHTEKVAICALYVTVTLE
jgi:hypothetical protein